jgi:hypothetical protein
MNIVPVVEASSDDENAFEREHDGENDYFLRGECLNP